MTTEFEDAYRRTTYWVEAPSRWIRLRVGETNDDLAELLTSHGAARWAFVTADNPGSQPLPPMENGLRREALRDDILHECFPGVGVGDDGTWPPEHSFFVLGICRDAALDLGRRYGQVAILYGERGGPVELLACDEKR